MNVTELSACILLERVTEFTLCSIDENGYPRACIVTKVHGEAYNVLYCSTGMLGTKVKHFLENEKASACYYFENDSVTLVGRVSIVDEPESRRALWQDWMIHKYPAGLDDPNLCFLKFTGETGSLLIHGQYEDVACPGSIS